MKQFTVIVIAFILCFSTPILAQKSETISFGNLVKIVKAEDELRYDQVLENFMKSKNPSLRKRAALAAGRIGNEDSLPLLEKLLVENNPTVQQMAAFAIGEIESIKGAESILKVLADYQRSEVVRARAIEAAGKIAAANEKEELSKALGKAILGNLEFEVGRRSAPSERVILLGLTATLRAKPKDAEKTVVKFLRYSSWRIRADALNTLARLRAKNGNPRAVHLLSRESNPIVRANAARVLGAAKATQYFSRLVRVATKDVDLRVRVNAIRALSGLGETYAAPPLLERAEKLFIEYKNSKHNNPIEKNELLTIVSALGNILKDSNHKQVMDFLKEFRIKENYLSPEIEVAYVRISPVDYLKTGIPRPTNGKDTWKEVRSVAAALTLYSDPKQKAAITSDQSNPRIIFGKALKEISSVPNKNELILAIPSMLNTYASFKPDDLEEILKEFLKHTDFAVRDSAARLLGDIKPATPEQAASIYRSLSNAFWVARTDSNVDASLAILGALEKQYENRPKPMTLKVAYLTPFISALESPDYLVRRKAVQIYKKFKIDRAIPSDVGVVKNWKKTAENGSKTRVVRVNYKRALSRKNGKSKAILTTEKGKITIHFFPEEAPLTVENYIKLAKSGYFDGLAIHRVVPNFVMQDGDPRGDGNGGPGWQIRCEINQIPYTRGMVGMALSGKDTGGSQWFVAHSPQPHLDGGYTVFGKVNEKDMKIVDNLVRGDKILSVKIVEEN